MTVLWAGYGKIFNLNQVIMKKISLFLLLFISCVTLFGSDVEKVSDNKLGRTPIVLAYVTAGSDVMPDPNYVTHINYAFGYVAETFDGVKIQNEERLRSISSLKDKYPHLKVVLSIGGWTSGRFSEMAMDDNLRMSFAVDCKRIVDEFNLDGIDIDWEYPTSSEAGISSSPADKDNFTLLMRDIRSTIGDDKLLTLASAYTADYYDFKAIDKYIDFINIMTYDMGRPPYHNSPLYKSDHTRDLSSDQSVDKHVQAGIPINKLTLGMPFYGHAVKEIRDFLDFKDLHILDKDYTQQWDSVAQVPYYVDKDGKFICSYDDAKSLEIKCKYLLEKGMLGAMYWEYTCDDADGTLRKVVYNTVMQKNN